MSFAAIAYTIPQYENYPNWWLKAYEQGTTTPKVMGLDSDGAVTVAKLEINSDGFPNTTGNALVIPYIDGDYDLWLFPTELEADNNDTTNALQFADDINAEGGASNITKTNIGDYTDFQFLTVSDMADHQLSDGSTIATLVVGNIVEAYERSTSNGGGGKYKVTTVGTTPNVDLPNTHNVIESTVDAGLCFVLVSASLGIVSQWASNPSAATDAIQACNNYSEVKELVFDQVMTIEAASTLTLTKSISAPDARIFNIDGTLELQGLASVVSSLWFDDDPWDSLKLGAETLASYRGGYVEVVHAIYDADVELSISSEYPVHLTGSMWTAQQANDEVLVPGNYITPKTGLGASDAIIEYSGDGGGRVRGLSFVDDNDISNATQKSRRTVSFGAALKLTEWQLSTLSQCYGLYLDASFIQTGQCTMSNIENIWARRCGGTGKPTIDFANTGGGFSAQSFSFKTAKLEVNYDDSYIELGTETTKCKLFDIGFEADASEADTNQTFIENNGDENNFTLIHLNRNTATKTVDTGTDSQWDNIRASTSGTNGVFSSTGQNFNLVNYVGKNNTLAVDEILSTGNDATIQGTINSGGGVRCTGDNADVDVKVIALQNATNAAVEVADKSKATIDFRDPVATNKDALLASGNTNRIYGCHIEDIPSGQIGINAGTSQNVISNNQIIAPTGSTGIDTSAGANNNVIGNNAQGAGTDYNLSGSDTSTANT